MGKAIMRISFALLDAVLCLPEGTTILQVREDTTSMRWPPDSFEVWVEHADLPEVPEGGQLPRIYPRLRIVQQTATEFVDWGLP